jgi:hypothetical protein
MNAYIIHYNGKLGPCCAVEYGRDVFAAVQSFMVLRKLSQIYIVRRMTDTHNSGPVYL